MGDEKIIRIPGENLSIKYSPEESSYREKYLPDPTKLTDEKLVCTVCSKSLSIDVHKGKDIFVHRVLNVLVCEACYNFYGDGNFSVDEDGDDKYCRWCGQGGTLYLCSTCSCAFCQKCVKQNLKASVIAELEKDDWKCYICNPRPLFGTRTICWGAEQINKAGKEKERERLKKLEEKKREENEKRSRRVLSDDENRKKKRKRSVDSDSTSPEVIPSKKPRGHSKASQNGFGKGRRRRKSSSGESSEDGMVSKHSRSRTTTKKKNISYAESTSDDESNVKHRNKKKIKKKKAQDTSDDSSEDTKSKTKRKSIKKTVDSSDESSNEEKAKSKKSLTKKKQKDYSDSSIDEKKQRKKVNKNKKETSSDDSSEENKRKSSNKIKKTKKYSSEEESDIDLRTNKKYQKINKKSNHTLESDSDSKKSKKKADDESISETSPKNIPTDNQTEDKIVKKRIKLAVVWLSSAAKDIAELGTLISVRAAKFKQKKINSENLKTYEDVIKTVNKVKQLITGVHSNYEHIEKNLEAQFKPWKILTGIEEIETKSQVDNINKEIETKSQVDSINKEIETKSQVDSINKGIEDTSSNKTANVSETVQESGSNKLTKDSSDKSCPLQNDRKSNTPQSQIEIQMQWSGDEESDSEKHKSTKDLISKANETLDKMEEEEISKFGQTTDDKQEETILIADEMSDPKTNKPSKNFEDGNISELNSDSDGKCKQKGSGKVGDANSKFEQIDTETIGDFPGNCQKDSQSQEIDMSNQDSNKQEINNSATSNLNQEKLQSRSDLDKKKKKIDPDDKSSRLNKDKQHKNPTKKEKKDDSKFDKNNKEYKEIPDTNLKSSKSSKTSVNESGSDCEKDLFSKKNIEEKINKKKSQGRRCSVKKGSRKSVKEKSKPTGQ